MHSPPAAASVLALDLGGTKIATALLTPDGDLIGEQVLGTEPERGPDEVIKRIFELGHRSLDAAGLSRPAAVGITSGGPLDPIRGILHEPLHLPNWHAVPIGPLAAAEFDAPSTLANDGYAAAWGEYCFGVGRGARTLLYLTLSTGVGGGAVIEGVPYRGATGNGGEFGHLTVRSGGRQCSCPRRGCLEAYCSGTSIAARARELAPDRPTITARELVALAGSGVPWAFDLWDETIALLADGLTSLINIFEPDRVVLGGGVANAGPMLLDPLSELVAELSLSATAGSAIMIADRPGRSGLLGAGSIALRPVPRPDLPTQPQVSHV
ncbi:ROK family protein [Microlunatus soli]|uniref:Glucokinase n=1 Tax=Microlunatus soli TaxID=630515 RepID=A0A1H1W880_9ACTN|nr:ROK family protein [Microlunatus soli]SDS93255.1 glucokinase [Microlunatus soli]